MKHLKILAAILIVAIILSISVSFLLSTAQAAENTENPNEKQEVLPLPKELEDYGTGLEPTQYTPETYVEPQYDPFNNKFRPYTEYKEKIEEELKDANTAPLAKFRVASARGIADKNSGTTATEFKFSATSSSDSKTRSSELRARWDFDSDGKWDSFFSRNKMAKHIYEKPGIYTVTLEVLDDGGLTSKAVQQITVVENTEPFAHFTYKPVTGTTEKIFTFNTSESEDSQYRKQYLEYRFDWDSDGQWDTEYESKTSWSHKFNEAVTHHVTMEVKDPEDAVSRTEAYIKVTKNIPPTASFTMQIKPYKVKQNEYRDKYFFDASNSSDHEDPDSLKYRWDFNYTGPNDISFTTGWRTSPKFSGMYDFPGRKTVRLQVQDEDGATHDAFINIEVSLHRKS